MVLRLKSLELLGYKTFASRTEFVFSGPVTAIVGPNGSGKSNIADSVRWVLGEQSYSLLRGKRTEDMIFSGSELRPRAGMASATIEFDNSDGWLPIDFSEVAITRRAYRDGDNEYLINGQRVRLRDVSELLARSGLAERTYTVIGQGLVDAALALKAEERRKLFEEAAGIGLYRSRREESLKRLETTRHNLERVKDILAELQPRLRSLDRQARRALEYAQVRNDLHSLLREWYGYHWHRCQQEYLETREIAHSLENSLENVRQEYLDLSGKLTAAQEGLHNLRSRLGSWHRELAQLHTAREALGRYLAVSDERERALKEQSENLQAGLIQMEEEIGLGKIRLDDTREEMEHLNMEVDDARAQVEATRLELNTLEATRAKIEEAVFINRQQLAALTAQQSHLQARLLERERHIQKQNDAQEEVIAQVAVARLEAENALKYREELTEKARLAKKHFQDKELRFQTHMQQQERLEKEVRAINEKRLTTEAQLSRLKSQLDILEDAEASLTGYASGARMLLEAAREVKFRGVRGLLSAALDIDASLEPALAAALGEFAEGVLLESGDKVDDALDLLESQPSRAILLPLDTIDPKHQAKAQREIDGFIGVASELVNVLDELRPVVNLLLGDVWVVSDRSAARRCLSLYDKDDNSHSSPVKVVTLKGEVFYPRGPVLVNRETRSVALGRPRQRRELNQGLASVNKLLTHLDDLIKQSQQELGDSQEQAQRLKTEMDGARKSAEGAQLLLMQQELVFEEVSRQQKWLEEQSKRLEEEINRESIKITQLKGDINSLAPQINQVRSSLVASEIELAEKSVDDLQTKLSHWTTRVAVAERGFLEAERRHKERLESLELAESNLASLKAKSASILEDMDSYEKEKVIRREEEAQITRKIEELHTLIDPAEQELITSDQSLTELQKAEGALRQAVSMAEHRHAQAKINLARRYEALEGMRRRIEDDFGLVAFDYAEDVSGPTPLPLNGMVEQLPVLNELSPELDDSINRQRAHLRRIGPVNLEAQAEFEEVRTRFEFMVTQVSDLEKAEGDIKDVITELDQLMERDFRKTFEAVAHEFREIFIRLFDGGSAQLVLTDPDDLTETGIDIEARLPGRRTQGLSLLSGGERSLTATALIFALLKVSPTPFCILDEVDAMLDETNVGRFRDLLGELSKNTQFIVVTHNRNTVQVADVIYGVTMGRDSSSQVLSLKLDEVSEVYEG